MANLTKPIILDETGQAIATAIGTLGATSVGNLSSLTTTDKTSLVGAVNEVNNNKQNATDNNLETTDKTVVGAVNELKSGLTNYENQNDRNLEVPNRKNLFDPNSKLQLGFSNSIGTGGTFTSGSYYAYVVTKRSVPTFTISGVDYTKMEDASIRVFVSSSYPAVGVAQWRTSNISDLSSKTVTLSENDKYLVFLIKWEDTATQADKEAIMVEEGYTATTFAPYIPSVDARLDAVESGLTNLDVALSVPEGSGKNFIPLTIDNLKVGNTDGTWTGNTYTKNDYVFEFAVDSSGNITSITVTGSGTGGIIFNLADSNSLSNLDGKYILSGCPSGGSVTTYYLDVTRTPGTHIVDSGSGVNIDNDLSTTMLRRARIVFAENYIIPAGGLVFYPMLRLASVSDPTFAPYIPSVDARLNAVESGLTKISILRVYKKWASSITVPAGMNTIVMFAKVSGQSNMFTYNSYSDVLTPIGNSSGVTATRDASTETVTFSADAGGNFSVYIL